MVWVYGLTIDEDNNAEDEHGEKKLEFSEE